MNDNRNLGASKRDPAPYQGNILAAYHDRGVTNGWKAAQPSTRMGTQPDPTVTTRYIEVQVTRIERATVIVEVQNANESDACTEASYLLERKPELLDAVDTWSNPVVSTGHGKTTHATDEPITSFCMLEEYARRRDLHKNAVRIPLTFEKPEGNNE